MLNIPYVCLRFRDTTIYTPLWGAPCIPTFYLAIVKRFDGPKLNKIYFSKSKTLNLGWKQFVQIINHNVGAIVLETVRLAMAIDTDD